MVATVTLIVEQEQDGRVYASVVGFADESLDQNSPVIVFAGTCKQMLNEVIRDFLKEKEDKVAEPEEMVAANPQRKKMN